MVQINLSSGQEQRCRSRDWTCGHDGAGGGVRWLVRLTLIPYCVRQKASGNLLCSAGSSAQGTGMESQEGGDICESSVQLSSVPQACPTLCDPMGCSTPGLPVHHQLPELTQTHIYWISDAMQPSHPQSPPSPFTYNLSQQQGLFQWVSSSHQVTKVLEFQLQHQSFQWTPRTDLLQDGLVGSPHSPKDSQESSPTPQFKSINASVFSFLYRPTLTSIHDHWKNHSLD